MKIYQHVIWTTWGCWRPDEKRGSWRNLGTIYRELLREYPTLKLSSRLPDEWNETPFLPEHVSLSAEECENVTASIQDLARTNGDRVAGNTPIHVVSIEPTCVHLIISCDAEKLIQKLGRLKSRSSSLLHREFTWGAGFWYSEFYEPRIIQRLETHITEARAESGSTAVASFKGNFPP